MSRAGIHPLAAILLAFLSLAALLAACGRSGALDPFTPNGDGAQSSVMRIAAASDLRPAMDDLLAAWRATHPGSAIEVAYGSSGTLFAQLSQGAPYGVFFSADVDYPRRLEEAALAERGATRQYAIGQLSLWVPSDSALDVTARGLEALADQSVGAVAIANPEHAPYGRAAVAALRAAGVYEAVEARLVLGDNVAQAAQFVESGAADAGVIALSLALAPPLSASGRHVIVPRESYPALEQGAVVLASATNPAAATAFVDFVVGSEGQAILDRHGFLPPP